LQKGRLNANRFAPRAVLTGAGLAPADPKSDPGDYETRPSQDLAVDRASKAVEPLPDLVVEPCHFFVSEPNAVVAGKDGRVDLIEHENAKADKEQHLTDCFPVHYSSFGIHRIGK
jgi:hypothetical protein